MVLGESLTARLAQPLGLLVDDHVVGDVWAVAALVEALLAAVADDNHVGRLRVAAAAHLAEEVVVGEAEVGNRRRRFLGFRQRVGVVRERRFVLIIILPYFFLDPGLLQQKNKSH